MQISKPKILIGLPTMGNLHVLTAIQLLVLTKQDYEFKVYPTICISPVDNARNTIVEEFLKTDFDYLFFLDSDTIPPSDVLTKLLLCDADIASALTPIVEFDEAKTDNESGGWYKKWNCVGLDQQRVQPHTGIQELIGAGASCFLIKRKVLEDMPQPWFRFLYSDDNGKKCYVGEDVQFIAKAKSMGFKVVCDTSIICGHNKSIIW